MMVPKLNSVRIRKIVKEIKSQLYNVNHYVAGNFRVIENSNKDVEVSSKYSFEEWGNNVEGFPVTKIEGMENNNIVNFLHNKPEVDSIHVFLSNKSRSSFKWHVDDCTVVLMVLQGKKIVNIRNKKYIITPNEFVVIPKGHIHRVFSTAGTIALSIGLK